MHIVLRRIRSIAVRFPAMTMTVLTETFHGLPPGKCREKFLLRCHHDFLQSTANSPFTIVLISDTVVYNLRSRDVIIK